MNNEPQHDNGEERLTRQQYRQQQSGFDDQSQEQSVHHSRAEQKVEQEQLTSEQKMHLRKRLNIAIVALVGAIIVVYLILFFVK